MAAVSPAQDLSGTVAALQLSTRGTGVGISNETVGWTFDISETLMLTHLGIMGKEDNNSTSVDAFTESRQIGIWNPPGTLIASTTIQPLMSGAGYETISGNRGFWYNELSVSVELPPRQRQNDRCLLRGQLQPRAVL